MSFNLFAFRKYLSLNEFETETPFGRSKERHRRALLTVIANVLSRGISLLAVVVSLRIALPYLGEERFGVMSTITSIATLLTFLDLGVSNGLVSQIARLRIDKDRVFLARLISNALSILGLIGIFIAGLLFLLAWYSPLAWAFKGIQLAVLVEARSTLILFAILFGLSIPLGAMQRIFSGMQEGYTAQLVTAGLSLLGLAVLYLLPYLNAGMPTFLAVTYGTQVMGGAVMFGILLARKLVIRPRLSVFRNTTEINSLLKTSSLFFVLQIGTVLGWGADNLIISSLLGPADVTQLVVVQRIFMFVTIPLSIINAPLWAGYADAMSRGDKEYVTITFKRSITMTLLLACLGGFIIVLTYGLFADFFSKGTVFLSFEFVCLYAVWSVMESTGNALAMYLNGMHIVKAQVLVIVFFVVISIPLKLFFIADFGVTGVLIGAILAYVMTTIIPYLTIFRRSILAPIS